MLGSNHLEFVLHCLRAKAARDMKSSPLYASDALRRLRLNNECQRIMQMMLENPTATVVDVAQMLGWQPPLVSTERLDLAAAQWLDTRA